MLVNLEALLKKAEMDQYALGAFNVANMEMILGAIKAAEDLNSPIIIQIAEGRLPFSPINYMGPMMVEAAKSAKVPVVVHIDHGKTISVINQALELGFSSVMIDASELPVSQNIEVVCTIKKLADKYHASVEAEVGQIGGREDDKDNREIFYSEPGDVMRLYEKTKVNAIALSFGNVHGLYSKEPKLKFELLTETKKLVDVPLVLHGGSGISDFDFKKCIKLGIRKINIATSSFMAVEAAAREYSKEDKNNYFRLSRKMAEGMYENVKKHIELFGSKDKA